LVLVSVGQQERQQALVVGFQLYLLQVQLSDFLVLALFLVLQQ